MAGAAWPAAGRAGWTGRPVRAILVLAGMLLAAGAARLDAAPRLELETGLGGAFFLGDFRAHLERDGAWQAAPTAWLGIGLYPLDWLGLVGRVESSAVIHPWSRPLEGTLSYQGLGPSVLLAYPGGGLQCYGLAGFQHATMSLLYYGSGFFQLGLTGRIDLGGGLRLDLGLAYRRGFLASLLVKSAYGLAYPVVTETLVLDLGLGGSVALSPGDRA